MRYLSSSSKATWLACRLKSYYAKSSVVVPPEVNANLIRGTAGHAALEYFHKVEPHQRSLEALLANARLSVEEQAAALDDPQEWHVDEFRAGLVGAERALTTFWKTVGRDEGTPAMDVEVNFETLLIPGWAYHGIIDGLAETAGGLVIYEHKFPTSNPSDLLQYTHFAPQVREYAWGLDTPLQVWVRFTVCGPSRTAHATMPVPRSLIDEAGRNLRLVAREMEEGVIGPTEGIHCLRCPFKGLCLARTSGGEIDYYKEGSNDAGV